MAISDFLINTDYPIDKIVFMQSGSFSAGVTFSFLLDINVSTPFAFLPIFQWSNNSNFEPVYTGADATYASGQSDPISFIPYGQFYNVVSYPGKLTFIGFNNSGGTKTVYWRVVGLMPSTQDGSSIQADFTSSLADSFALNSGYNYMKLIDRFALPNNLGADVSYNHNLGKIPTVMTWGKLGDGYTSEIASAQLLPPFNSETGLEVTASSITWLQPNSFEAIEIRLYDEVMA